MTTLTSAPRQTAEPTAARGTGFFLLALAAVAALAFVATRLSHDYFKADAAASALWWPATGLVLAIVVNQPARRWWPLLVVFGIGTLYTASTWGSWMLASVYAVANVLEIIIAALLLRPVADADPRQVSTPREAARFVTAILGSVLVAALPLVAVLPVAPPQFGWLSISLGHVVGHGLGILVLAPLLLRGMVLRRRSPLRTVEYLAVLLGSIVLDVYLFVMPRQDGRAFAVMLFIVWAALRFDRVRVVVVSFTTCCFAAYAGAAETGILAQIGDPHERGVMSQIVIGAIAVVSLVLLLISRHRAAAAERAQDSVATLQIALQEALVGLLWISLEPGRIGDILGINETMCALVGCTRDEALGEHYSMFIADRRDLDAEALDRGLQQLADGDIDALQRENRFATRDGTELWVELSATRVVPTVEAPFALVYVYDLTARREAKQQLEAMALHDGLTGLPNRSVLFSRLDDLLHAAYRSGRHVGVLYLDLDGFKPVNDTYGHAAGDAVLIEVARRLVKAVRPIDTVARLGGDEFAVITPDIDPTDSLTDTADRLATALRAPIVLPGGDVVQIGASIGIATSGGDMTADDLMRHADAAMYTIKVRRRPADR